MVSALQAQHCDTVKALEDDQTDPLRTTANTSNKAVPSKVVVEQIVDGTERVEEYYPTAKKPASAAK